MPLPKKTLLAQEELESLGHILIHGLFGNVFWAKVVKELGAVFCMPWNCIDLLMMEELCR